MSEFDPWVHIKKVSFELSNLCPFAPMHKACPAHLVKKAQILPFKIVEKVIKELKIHKYSGWISPFIYNEPMVDPRLFRILEFIRSQLPDCKIRILTNGFYVDQTILDEVAKIGIQLFKVDAYSQRDLERLRGLKSKRIPRIKITKGSLDDRMKVYDLPPKDLRWPCFAPYADINVKSSGDVNLCCLDYEARFCFGNLHKQSLEEILFNSTMIEIYKNLSKGNRKVLPICRACNRQILGYACKRKTKDFEVECEF